MASSNSLRIGTAGSSAPFVFAFTASSFSTPNAAGAGLTVFAKNSAAGSMGIAIGGDTTSQTSGTNIHLHIARSFLPTSGTGTFDAIRIQPTINQTGGANGITRTCYFVPAITAAADHRIVEIADAGAHCALKTGTGAVKFGDGLSFTTVAKGLTYKSGTGARTGNATLVGGTVTVTNTSITANTIVIMNRKTIGGTVGNMSYTLSAGASFTINSSSGTDTSVISYELVELV